LEFHMDKIGPLLVGDRPMPQSIDAEKAVLSCLLLDPAATIDFVFSKIQTEECFHLAPHRRIYSVLKEMRGEMLPGKIDLITVTDKLVRNGTLDSVGGEDYLNHLLNIVPTTANIEKYVECVLNSHILRSMICACGDIVGRCYEANGEVDDLIDIAERQILQITEIRTDTYTQSLRDLMPEAVKFLEALSNKDPSAIGLSTGFADIDRIISGLKRGELIVLAGRPSMGKTALALDIARNVAITRKAAGGKTVGIFSLEMGSHQVVLRILCAHAKVNMKDVRDGKLSNERWATEIMGPSDELRSAPIFIDDTPQLSALELRQKARRMKQDHDVQLIIIDYLQLMRPSGINKMTSREQEVAKLSADIKALAKELNIPILLLCQLNRQAEQGDRPKLSHLRESGAIEQDADIVMLLHRDRDVESERYTDVGDSDDDESRNDDREKLPRLIVAKNRNGETGILNLIFKAEWASFKQKSPISDADVPSNF
jgi:replicative DNA helicase